ncbi:hypothetical protein CH76_01975 [Lysinibacillus sp. BF-4]|nr:hypothetical protein CH76_01975 [Lysinibacillus sp. BF-4]
MPTVYAEDDKVKLSDGVSEAEVIEMHQKMDSVLHLDNGWLYQDVIRSIGWGTLKILVWIVNYIEDGVNGILQWNNFYESSGVGTLMKQLTPFVIGLFLIALIYLGFQFMTNKIDKREEVLMNVLMAFSLIFLVPALMPYMDKVLKVGVSQLEGEDNLKLSESLIKQNVADIKYYVDSGFAFNQLGLPIDKTVGKGEKRGTTDYANANKISGTRLNITEKLDLQSDKFAWWSTGYKKKLEGSNKLGHDFLMTQTVYQGDGNKVRLKALADNKIPTTTLGQESYYRYHINWGTLIFSFLVIGVALAITVIKMARVIFDLGFHAIFGMFVAATDLTGGQRTKKIVTEIVSSFAVLFVMVLILKLFTLYVNWVTGLSSTVGGVIMVLMLIAGAWALIDAPDIVQRLLGIDAGLRSGWQAMMGAYAGAKTIGAGLKGVEKVAVGAGKMAKGGLAFGKGLAGAAPNKASASHVKPMPNAGGFNGSSANATDALGSVKGMPQDLESKGGVGGATEEAMMPSDSSTIQETPQGYESGSKQNANETKSHNPSMPTQMNKASGSSKIQPNDNPYQGYGLLSGSRAGQSTADLQARAYNTGASTRAGLGIVGGGMGRLAMGSARFMASPIRSSRNIAGATAGRMVNVASTVGRNVKSMPSRVGAAAGNFVSRVNTPIGSANSSVSTAVGAANHAATASTSSMSSSVVGQTQPSMTSSASVGSATMPTQGPRNVMSVSQAMLQQVTGVPSVSRAVTSQAAQRIQSSGSTGSVASASSPSAPQSGGVRTVGSVTMPTTAPRNVMSSSQAMPQQMATTPSVNRTVTNQAAQQVQGVVQSHGSGGSVVDSPSAPQSGGVRTVGSAIMPTQGSRNVMSGSQLTSQQVTPTSSSSNVAANQPSQPTQVTRGTKKTVNATTKGQNRTLRSENTINNKK